MWCLPKQIPLKLRADPGRELLSTYSADAKSVTSGPPAPKQGRLARYEEMAKFKTRYEHDDTGVVTYFCIAYNIG